MENNIENENASGNGQGYIIPAYQRAGEQHTSEPLYSAPLEQHTNEPQYNAPTEQNASEPQYGAPPEQHTSEPQYGAQPEQQHTSEPLYNAQPEQQSAGQPQYGTPPEQYTSEPQYNAPPEQHTSEPLFFTSNYQAAGADIPHEDARFSEVSSETNSTMYTPGIRESDPYRQRARYADTPQEHRERQRRPGAFFRALCLIVVCAVLSGAVSFGVIEYRLRDVDFTPVNQVVIGGSNSSSADNNKDVSINTPLATTGREMTAQDIYDMACSQVVGITIEVENVSGFFGQQGSMTAVSGSGFIISTDGYILTNYHVIETAYLQDLPIIVHMNDETTYEAKIIGFESTNDVALIKIEATGLKAAAIANSDNIRVGQRVYAVGNPFGELVYTMTEGIVSALDRVVTVENKSINTFQLSAAVNPGNSGCPVYDGNGEVIGIVSAKFMSSSVEGIGFAIPINDAIAIASDLIEHGYIPGRAYMGINVNTVTRGNSEYFGWGVLGAYVTSVSADSAADKAGIIVADIITKLGDDEITTREDLVNTLRKYSAGDTAIVTVRRSGEDIELTITFDENLAAGQPQQQQAQQPQQQQQVPIPPNTTEREGTP